VFRLGADASSLDAGRPAAASFAGPPADPAAIGVERRGPNRATNVSRLPARTAAADGEHAMSNDGASSDESPRAMRA
jgi:hypothetical protein